MAAPHKGVGYKLLKCNHEGCYVCWPCETLDEIAIWYSNKK